MASAHSIARAAREVQVMSSKKTVAPIRIKTTAEYDPEKAVHTLAYVAKKLGGAADMYKLLKIIYFADKRHLERYGRFIFGDTYIAMNHGPVPSGAYDAIKDVRGMAVWCRRHPLAKKALRVQGTEIIPTIEPDLDLFSESDLECLDETIRECRDLSFQELKKRSHGDPAFRKADANGEMTIESIAATLPNAGAVLEYLHGSSE
jgi:uncharacterized phage-associated protein